MAERFGLHSQVVFWLKIILPLVALALLSTLFLFSRNPSGNGSFEKDELERLAREGRIGTAVYSTVTDNGTSVSVTAETARPPLSRDDTATAVGLFARIEDPKGRITTIRSAEGRLLPGGTKLELEGDVEIVTPAGLTITGERIDADIDALSASSDLPVRVVGRGVTLDGGTMRLWHEDNDPEARMLRFDKGVHVIYDPAATTDGAP